MRYDEVAAGVINHAFRMTLAQTKSDANGGYFVAPATHAAGNNSSTGNIMGMRLRLKASFDISSYSAANQVILTAMKNYGMIVADNGSNMYLSGRSGCALGRQRPERIEGDRRVAVRCGADGNGL